MNAPHPSTMSTLLPPHRACSPIPHLTDRSSISQRKSHLCTRAEQLIEIWSKSQYGQVQYPHPWSCICKRWNVRHFKRSTVVLQRCPGQPILFSRCKKKTLVQTSTNFPSWWYRLLYDRSLQKTSYIEWAVTWVGQYSHSNSRRWLPWRLHLQLQSLMADIFI